MLNEIKEIHSNAADLKAIIGNLTAENASYKRLNKNLINSQGDHGASASAAGHYYGGKLSDIQYPDKASSMTYEADKELEFFNVKLPLKQLKPNQIQVEYCKDVSDGFIKHNIIHIVNLFTTIEDIYVLRERIQHIQIGFLYKINPVKDFFKQCKSQKRVLLKIKDLPITIFAYSKKLEEKYESAIPSVIDATTT